MILKKFLQIFLLVFIFDNLYSQIDDETRFERFFNNFYSKPDYVENQNKIIIEYGLSFPNFGNDEFSSNFMNTYQVQFNYGFHREDHRLTHGGLFKHQGEFAFVANNSTNFKTFNISPNGVITDSWIWGVGLNDGYGYLVGEFSKIYLNHAIMLNWIHLDFDIANYNDFEQRIVNIYDENYKFGGSYVGGFGLSLSDNLTMDFSYQTSLFYQEFDFMKYAVVWFYDIVLQRLPDLLDKELFEIFGINYGWMHSLYKNLVSLFFWNLRKEQAYFPFESPAAMYYDTYKVGFKYIF